MAGIIAVYALVVAVLIASNINPPTEGGSHYSLFNGFMHLAAGLSVGLTGLAAGYAIGVVGDTVRLLWNIRKRIDGTLAQALWTRAAADTICRAYEHTCNNHESSSAWCSSSFSVRSLGSTGKTSQQTMVQVVSHANIVCSLIVSLILNTRAQG